MNTQQQGRPYQTVFIFIFFALLAMALLAPIASETALPNLADYINHIASIVQANLALQEGQFPLRVAPLESHGWRYPLYQFYSPTAYTFTALIYKWITHGNPLVAFKLVVWCALMLGAIYMYRLTYWFVKSSPAALLSSVAYLTAPYYIIIINRLGDLTESIALGIIPAVLFYTVKLYYDRERRKSFLILSLLYYFLATTHLVTFIYFSLICGLLFLSVTLKNPDHRRALLSVSLAYLLGCLLAAWFLAPIILLGHTFVIVGTFGSHDFNFFQELLSYLVFPSAAITNGYRNMLLTIHPSLGWPQLFAVGIASYAWFHNDTIKSKRANYLLPYLLCIFYIAFFFIWSPFNYAKFLPLAFSVGQYSWRFMGQTTWIGALLFAFSICWLFKDRLNSIHIILGTLLIAMLNGAWFPTLSNASTSLSNFLKKPLLIYNETSYQINFNKNKKLINAIDNMNIRALVTNSNLKLNTPYILPTDLPTLAGTPTVLIEANLPVNFDKLNLQLDALVDNKIISTQKLHAGALTWSLPIQPDHALQFKLHQDNPQIAIPITRVVLTGFLNPTETLDVSTVQPHCQQKNTETRCDINVPANIHLIELPVLYYPTLLAISINNHPARYQSIVYKNSLITSVIPEPGNNKIKITFQGLVWANRISWIAWIIWIAGIITLKLKKAPRI